MAPVQIPFRALLTVTAVVATTLVQLDPCTSYIELNDDRRSVAYEVSQVDNFRTISDFNIITNGRYYRFTAHVGERIPTGPIDNDLCGTFYPISMTEQHPEDGIEERQVCARAYGRSDCFWEATIGVRFCINGSDSYIVYQLQQPPYGDMAYCAGEGEACPRGQVWVKGGCNENQYPAMTSVPTLSGPEVTDIPVTQPTCPSTTELFTYVSRFYFTCTVGYESLDEQARFDVTFWANNVVLHQTTLRNPNLKAILYEDYLAGHVGKSVACSVVSYWDGESVYRSDELESDTYWMGIYPDNNKVVLHERNFPAFFTLKFNSTIPVTCWHCKEMIEKFDCSNSQTIRECSGDCLVKAQINSTQGVSKCFLNLTGRSGELEVQVKRNSGLMEQRFDEISFLYILPIVGFTNNTFQSYQIENVKIITEDTDEDSMCMLTGDPHITTFDGRYYDAYGKGIYLVWKAPGGSVEIQAKFVECGLSNHVACISEIAVREFNHVIRLDALLRAKELLQDEESTGYINVISKQNGRAAEILLSSGIQITATKWPFSGSYLNVNVKAHASFKGKNMFGLCGDFNGDLVNEEEISENHQVNAGHESGTFPEGYRISPNYFNSPPQKKTFSITREQCGCSNGKIRCAANLAKVVKLLKVMNVNAIPGKRRKRSTSSADGADDWLDPADVYNYEEPEVYQNVSLTLEWPTASGITEEEATAICEQQLNRSPIADYCSQQANNVTRDIVRSCVADIQITGLSDVGSGLATFMEDVCISRVIATTNMTGQELVYDNSSGRYVPDDLLPVVQQICPNQCSGHGDCINGSCLCQPGFSDIDCAVDLSLPPQIIDSLGGGLCNIAIRACRRTTLYGSNLLNSPKLMCKVFLVTQLKDGTEMQSVTEEPAVYVTASEVSCQLPESPLHSADPGRDDNESPSVHTWYLSLTNDRLIYSEPHRYTLYDSLCQTCLNATACFQKPGTCDISQLCYIDGDPHPDDICRQCRSDVSMTQWSLSDNSPPELITIAIVTSLDSGEEQLEATDAEGHSITFRLISGSNVQVSEDGQLVWSALTGQDLDIEVAAIDECGASVTNTVRITLAAENKYKWTTILAAVVGACVALTIVVAVTIACKKCLQTGKVEYQITMYRPNASDTDHTYDSIRPASASSVPISVVSSSVPASRPMFQPI